MAEFPYFPLYWKDWLTGEGTCSMTPEQKGAFVDLLCHAWEAKPPCTLPDDERLLASWSGLGIARWRTVGALVRAQFVVLPDGRLQNPKQAEVRAEFEAHSERRRVAGAKGNAKRWGSQSESQCDTQCDRKASRNGVAKSSPASASADDVLYENPAPPRRGGWPAMFAKTWEDAYGGRTSIGAIGDHLKVLVKAHGEDSVLAVWRWYLGATEGKYASAANFAERYGVWAAKAGDASAVPSPDRRRIAAWVHEHQREAAEVRQEARAAMEAEGYRGADLETRTTAEFQRRVLENLGADETQQHGRAAA